MFGLETIIVKIVGLLAVLGAGAAIFFGFKRQQQNIGRMEERNARLNQQAQDVARANSAGANATDDDLLSPTDRNRK